MKRAWNAFWFTPEGPGNLGFLRLALLSGLFVIFRLYWPNATSWASVGDAFRFPVGVSAWLGLPRPSLETLRLVRIAWLAALFMAAIGLATRVTTKAALGLGLYMLGEVYGYGFVSHGDLIAVFVLVAFACSRGGDAWSVDTLIRTARAGRATPVDPKLPPSGEYRWPVRFVWLGIVLIYFVAGLAKLKHSGLAWALSDTMAIYTAENNSWYVTMSPHGRPLGVFLGGNALLSKLGAASGLALEVFFPLALVSPWARRLIVPAAIAFNVGVYYIMGPQFLPLVFTNAVAWVPWARVGARVQPLLPVRKA